jgi:hypothetical protein
MPSRAPSRTAYTPTGHGIGPSSCFGDLVRGGSPHRIVRVCGTWGVGHPYRRRRHIGPDITQDSRSSPWVSESRRDPDDTRQDQQAKCNTCSAHDNTSMYRLLSLPAAGLAKAQQHAWEPLLHHLETRLATFTTELVNVPLRGEGLHAGQELRPGEEAG